VAASSRMRDWQSGNAKLHQKQCWRMQQHKRDKIHSAVSHGWRSGGEVRAEETSDQNLNMRRSLNGKRAIALYLHVYGGIGVKVEPAAKTPIFLVILPGGQHRCGSHWL